MSEEPQSEEDVGTLQAALEQSEIQVTEEQMHKLEAYCRCLWEWNSKINLTRHTTFQLFVDRDLLDAVQLANVLEENEDVLDVGTGGGVPGLLLAILRPDLTVHVCDSVAKKARVVEDIVKKLDLPVIVHATRAQDVLEDFRFHSLVARAVGSLAKLLKWLEDQWLSFDRLLAIKGPKWTEERGEARHRGLLANVELRKLTGYAMPGRDSESVILQVNRQQS